MKIKISSPTRVDLAGGTLDLWPLYNFIDGAETINLAIDVMTHAEIRKIKKGLILETKDLHIKKTYTDLREALTDREPRLLLLRTVLKHMQPEGAFHLTTSSESPVGGGLGGSSSLMISLLKAFSKYGRQSSKKINTLVHSAHNLEAQILNTPTGTQDYYPAAAGGLNIIKYRTEGITHSALPLKGTPFEKKFLLVYTGRSHHSGLNNFEVLKAAVAKEKTTMNALQELKEIAVEMQAQIKAKDWSSLGELFQAEYAARVKLSPGFTCKEIQKLEKISLQAGAEAIKICGAGGGGCVMIWCPESERGNISSACQKAGFQVLKTKPHDLL